ncbi:unnamed protein product [Triticum aestivum]|uniref:KIB1-4 beta-propeller domain-containing protein n=3 Tax=Triticinae TaxID=1648030 RepID=A0A453C9B1_AEGTS|nr:uncharacterized protein LOC109743680 [Aegilops tauschii subsp. strangulata]XP_020158359.1 uncharacterized protein LOC109743680 [Aegilops tauschii subsp. strangulata]XP_044328376.1 uncharacterized protein LOC123049540 [Triticum aestivum]XP_044328377.1 uncharacterized protein LOC123049540 [Triticum aestivum]SPT18833.1 unnamed protein product [Triticum aestivum]
MSQELVRTAMAAAPGDVPPPLATPALLPQAKRVKEDPSFPQASPVVPAMTAEDWSKWSTLPPDLVRCIGDSLLSTNDLDCYIHFRAVCPGWRAAADDPMSDTSDPRFHPRRWIVLNEDFQSEGKLLLLNTDNGRFVHRKLPLLSDHYVVATTRNGYLVLADKSPPHSASVLNPLTGVVIRFMAPVPPEVGHAAVSLASSALGLTLFGDSSHKIYSAYPDNKSSVVHEAQQAAYVFFRNAVVGGVYSDTIGHAVIVRLCRSLMPPDANHLCFPVALGREMLLVGTAERSFFIFKTDIELSKLEDVDTINNYAIFIGHQRCLAVYADKFIGIEANCIYYTENLGSSARICKCGIKDRKVEKISETADFIKKDKKFVLVADRPSTIIDLLASYTINIPDSRLALQQIP